ncbi:MAG: hypothetical protein EZS28_047210 [Streblomastix strix]|uniref:Calpain catalytic domain-containing protein n=1 Tax=Streblomastix strix TaxID=222440 RepID=A0A5J4THG8_9EUKA|nr:MAG: hypothetical protein EZS28_047210 [Streblomastix strix]
MHLRYFVLFFLFFQTSLEAAVQNTPQETSSNTQYSKEELNILSKSSYIYGVYYAPWVQQDEKTYTSASLQRKLVESKIGGGIMILNIKQKSGHVALLPPQLFLPAQRFQIGNVSMFNQRECTDVRQTVVGDCSLVSSLALLLQLESRCGMRLLTKTIFAVDSGTNGQTSNSGQYKVRLLVNGIWRCIIVDDRLPVRCRSEDERIKLQQLSDDQNNPNSIQRMQSNGPSSDKEMLCTFS